jgi:Lrp/AsnC family leucine-responsive transcriptional regulator
MPRPRLDRIDRKILAILQTDARITNQRLAEAVALSPSACLARVRRLEEKGILARYLAEIDVERAAPALRAFVEITLESHAQEDFSRFDRHLAGTPEIVASWQVSGRFDYLLLLVVADMTSLRLLSEDLLGAGLGIEKFVTVPVLKEAKPFAGLPLERLLGEA